MFTKEAACYQGCIWEQVERLNELLANFQSLHASLFQEPAYENARIVHNVFLLSKALFFRLRELGHSTTILFNDGQIVSSLVIARSIIETAIFVADFENQIRQIFNRRDFNTQTLKTIDDLTINKMFSTRRADLLEENSELMATNVQTLLKKYGKENYKDIAYEYETLSEYAHPNTLGHFLAYSQTDMETGRVSFQPPRARQHGLFELVRLAFYWLALSGENLKLISVHAEWISALENKLRGSDD